MGIIQLPMVNERQNARQATVRPAGVIAVHWQLTSDRCPLPIDYGCETGIFNFCPTWRRPPSARLMPFSRAITTHFSSVRK